MIATELARAIAEIERDRPHVLRWVRAQGIASPEDAEDLLQRALRVLWQRASEAGILGRFQQGHRAYLFGILRNEIRNYRRSQRRHPAPAPITSFEADASRAEDPAAFAAWFARHIEFGALCRRVLDADDLRLLELHYFEGHSVAEIATLCDSTRGAVKMRMHRIRQRILAAFEAPPEDPPPTGPRGAARLTSRTSSEREAQPTRSSADRSAPRSEAEVDAWLHEYAAMCRVTGVGMFDHEARDVFPVDATTHGNQARVLAHPATAVRSSGVVGRGRRRSLRISILAMAAAFAALVLGRWEGDAPHPHASAPGLHAAAPSRPIDAGASTRRSSTAVWTIERSSARLDQLAMPDDPPRPLLVRFPGEWNSWCTEWWYPRVC